MTRTTNDPRRMRTRRAVFVVAGVGAIPVAVFAATTRAWVIPTLVVVGFTALGAGVLAWLGALPNPAPPSPGPVDAFVVPDAHVERVGRLRRHLLQATQEASSFDVNLQPVLARLADDRLRATYGITITTHPDAARARLGEELWQRLTTPSTQPVQAGELRRLVSALDRLSPPG